MRKNIIPILIILIFIAVTFINLNIIGCSDQTKMYRIVEMEDNTYVVQIRTSIFGWHQNIGPFASQFDSKEEACEKLERLNKNLKEAIKSNTIKKVTNCKKEK